MRAVFVHTGWSDYLPYTLSQALHSGLRVTLIGDAGAHGAAPKGVELAPIDRYSGAADRMTRAYRHLSSNHEHYERFCFERWFILRAYAEDAVGPVMLLDSDVLIYPGLDALAWRLSGLGGRLLNTPWCAPVWRLELLDHLLDEFVALFSDESRLEAVSRVAGLGRPHVTDMHLLEWLGMERPGFVADGRTEGRRRGLCSNIRAHHGWESFRGYRMPCGWDDRLRPLFRRGDADRVIPFSLHHFQGRSKFIMDRFCSFDTSGLPCLKGWLSDRRNAGHAQHADLCAVDAHLAGVFAGPAVA
jgi:hypothetical protein